MYRITRRRSFQFPANFWLGDTVKIKIMDYGLIIQADGDTLEKAEERVADVIDAIHYALNEGARS